MRRACLEIAALLCGVALLSSVAVAQYPKVAKQKPGSLVGEVLGAKGQPVSGAQILWQAADGETPHVLHSDAHGHFQIDPLRAGLYDVRASAGGARSEWKHNVSVRPGIATNVTLRLTFKAAPVADGLDLRGTTRTSDVSVPEAMPRDSAVDLEGDIRFTLQEARASHAV